MGQSNVTGLAHIGIFVKDIGVSVDFYKRLGFTLDAEENAGVKLAFISAGSCLIEFIEQKDYTARAAGPVDHIAVVVEDIEKAVSDAVANGIDIDASKINAAPILGGVSNVFFTGPDSERLEFFEYKK